MKRFTNITAAFFGILLLSALSFAQTTVFTDDFSADTNATYTTSGQIGTSRFSVTRSGADFGARRNTSPEQLELTNDATATANANGWVFASAPTTSFAAPYNPTLNQNPGPVTWTFNMRQIRPDPAGFISGSYGVAFVLGSTSTSAAAAGSGYAVVLGNSGATDSVRLVKFTNGLQSLGTTAPPTANDLIVSNTTGLTDFGAEYLSVKVTYNPSNNQWELFLRNDGATAFADPSAGTLVSQGTATDSTYTGVDLTALGGYWQGSTGAAQTAFFDNVRVTVTSIVVPNLAINDVSLDEGSSGTTAYTFTVSLSSPANAGGVTFDIATADGTATVADGDYAASSLTAQTIPQGGTSYTFNVTVNGDAAVEPNETFFVNVTNVTGAIVTDGQGQGTILNDDVEPATVEFSTGNYAEDESQTAVLTVQRFGNLSGTTSVNYSTQVENLLGASATGGASCTAGVDFIHASGTLNFAAEENAKEIQIQLCGDLIAEPDEFFTVYLSNPTGGVLGDITTAQVAVKDAASQFRNTAPIFIGTGGDSYDSSIEVTGAPTNIGSIRVTLFDFQHFTADDIDVLLVSPEGDKLLLMADAGGDDGLAEGASITFDDNAGQVLPDATQIFTGKYEPTSWEPGQTSFPAPAPAGPYSEPGSTVGGAVTLSSVFAGSNANGTWRLYIRDDNGAFQPLGADGVVAGGWGIQFLAPTAAGVSVSGQVRTSQMPIANATVTISGGDLDAPRAVKTNGFGNYSFEGLTAGQIYVVTVAAKRYTFAQSSIVLNVGENVTGADFEAEDN